MSATYFSAYTDGRAIVAGCAFGAPAIGRTLNVSMQCDDGSDVSAIDATAAAALGATATSSGYLTGVDGTPFETPIYTLNLTTPAGNVASWPFWQTDLGDVGGLIGQDLLSQGFFEETPAGFYLSIGSGAGGSGVGVADVVLLAGVGAGLALLLFAGRRRGGGLRGGRRVA